MKRIAVDDGQPPRQIQRRAIDLTTANKKDIDEPSFDAGRGDRRGICASLPRCSSVFPSASNDDTDGCKPFKSLQRTKSEEKWEDSDIVNAQIVKDLNEMSIKEREHLFDDIHGVYEPIEETEDFIKEKLGSFETALGWVKDRHAFERARFLSPSSVEDVDLRLMMLRSHNFDPIKAAKRFVKHLEFKNWLFGIDKLAQSSITQDDLTPGMNGVLRKGLYQIQPKKDRAGRSILFISIAYFPEGDWKNYFGMLWYVIMLAVTGNEDVQKKGIVAVVHHIGDQPPPANISRRLLQVGTDFERSMPCKAASYHFLYDSPVLKRGLFIMQHVLLEQHRLRVRAHYGSIMECVYKLMSYGITLDMLPLDLQGNILTAQWLNYLDQIREHERMNRAAMPHIVTPRSRDVVLGRGYPFQTFVGNVFLANIVQRNRERYLSSHRASKPLMMKAVVEYIQRMRGGIFLKRAGEEGTSWIAADDEEARKKVGHMFRSPAVSKVEDPSTTYVADSGEVIFVPLL